MRMNRRPGATLVELTVALVICAIVASAFYRAVHHTLRFVGDHTVEVEQRGQLQAAAHLFMSLLPDAAPAQGDLITIGDTAVTFRATIGIALACRTLPGGVEIAPLTLASGVALSAFTDHPQPGDLAARFDPGALASSLDDRWTLHSIVGVHVLTGACAGTPFAHPVTDAGQTGWTLDLMPAPPVSGPTATPLRLLRPQRLALYHASPDWMLGFTEWNGSLGAWNLIQPVAGALTGAPVRPPGVDLAWADSVFAPSLAATQSASVRLTVRAPTRTAIRHAGRRPGVRTDSLSARLAFRNRR
jgi:hypothetical protein